MTVKVAINGFGRIGCLTFRQIFEAEGCGVVAINDLIFPKMLAHLLKYDSTQGICAKVDTVVAGKNSITVDGKETTIYVEADTKDLSQGKLGVSVVLECTGLYTSKDKASAHIEAGVCKIVISAPAGNDLPTVMLNTNHDVSKPEDTVVSATSCTTSRLAPMAKALNGLAPIQDGTVSTIHAYTSGQMTLDGSQRKDDLHCFRTVAANIVPNSTGAAKAIGLVIPKLKGRLIGSAQRIPTPTGSTTILAAVVKEKVTIDEINTAMEAASNESFGYTTDGIVLSDVIGMRCESLSGATQTTAMEMESGNTQVRVVSWHNNGNSYTSQMARTIKPFSKLA